MKKTGLLLLLTSALFLSCAGFMKHMRSTTTKHVNRAPYYTGTSQRIDNVGHFSVVFDKRLEEFYFKDEVERRAALFPLLEAMNAYLDDWDLTKSIPAVELSIDDEPDVFVGNVASEYSPAFYSGDSEERPPMVVYYRQPSVEWRDACAPLFQAERVEYVLFLTLGFSEYFPRMKNLLGSKELELGTEYALDVKWLSDLDTPADVLHIAGMLLDGDGKIVRAGAEGIMAKQTGLWWSVLDIQETISAKDVDHVLYEEKRTDLAGEPLAWRVALHNLVAQLLNRQSLFIR